MSKLAPVSGRPSPTYAEAGKKLATLAVDHFALPGEAGFPLNSMYHAPANRNEAGECCFGCGCVGEGGGGLDVETVVEMERGVGGKWLRMWAVPSYCFLAAV